MPAATTSSSVPAGSPPLPVRAWAWLPWLAAAVLAVWLCSLVAVVMFQRITGPPQYDILSGAIIDHAVRVHDGLRIYSEPNADFVPLLYTPGYYYIVAGMMSVLGESFQTGQITSVLLLLISAGLMAAVVWKTTRSLWATLLVVPLFGYGYPLSDFYYDDPRVDPAVTLTMAAALWISVGGIGKLWKPILLGVVLTLAFWCKQTSVIFSGVLLLGLLPLNWKGSLLAGAVFGLLTAASVGFVNSATDGWFWTLAFEIPRTHAVSLDLARRNAVEDWLGHLLTLWPAALIAGLWFCCTWRGDDADRRIRALLIGLLAAAAYSVVSRANKGSTEKLLIPILVIFCAVIPVGLWRMERSIAGLSWRSIVHVMAGLFVAFTLRNGLFNRGAALQDVEEQQKWEDVQKEIERYAEQGAVWVPWGYITTRMPGQGMRANQMALADYLGGQFGSRTGQPIPPDIEQALAERRYVAIFYMAERNRPFRTLKPFVAHYELDHTLPIKQGNKRSRDGVGVALPRERRE